MKNLKTLVLAMVVILSVFTGNVFAEEAKASGYASVDVMSNYVWRGQKLSNGSVIQPSIGITYGSFDANFWANYDTDPDISEINETDLTLTYSLSMDKLNFAIGYIYYALDGTNDTQEIYFSIGYETFLSPALNVYYDYDEGDGYFVTASIGHAFELATDISLELGASASYNLGNKVMGTNDEGDKFSNFDTVKSFLQILSKGLFSMVFMVPN
ncbi:MAG: hypothetical protein AB1610_00620 [Nitrospirota bacterium]